MLIGSAVIGYWTSMKIPYAQSVEKDLKVNYNFVTETLKMLDSLFNSKTSMVQCAMGIAWFWFMGSVMLGQMPNFTKINLGANEHVSALFMVLFSIGIGLGGLLNNRLLRGRVEAVYVPLAALCISVFSIDLFFAGHSFSKHVVSDALITLPEFASTIQRLARYFGCGFLIAVFAGLFVIPLNAIFQHECDEKTRARKLAGMSILNSCFIALASLISSGLFMVGFSVPMLFLAVARGEFVCRALYLPVATRLFHEKHDADGAQALL